jgi:hypothetical protein
MIFQLTLKQFITSSYKQIDWVALNNLTKESGIFLRFLIVMDPIPCTSLSLDARTE